MRAWAVLLGNELEAMALQLGVGRHDRLCGWIDARFRGARPELASQRAFSGPRGGAHHGLRQHFGNVKGETRALGWVKQKVALVLGQLQNGRPELVLHRAAVPRRADCRSNRAYALTPL